MSTAVVLHLPALRMPLARVATLACLALLAGPRPAAFATQERPRPADVGLHIGHLRAGEHNAITDVPGVRVGHSTLRVADSLHTGVTAILPHGGDLYSEPVRAAMVVGNGYGKLIGLSQVQELGVIETPILLTGTLNVWRVADALVDTLLQTPGYESVFSINPVVGETNDGYLSDIRARPLGAAHVREALRSATSGPVEEGAIGAGTGTLAFGFKGGIGTSSRRVSIGDDSLTVGVLVQSNFGGDLVIAGVPVERRLRQRIEEAHDAEGGGSIMMVIATDAALDHRQLERLAARAFGGLARTGASLSHDSGDYAIAFTVDRGGAVPMGGRGMSRLFTAVMDATEEAIVASLFAARTTRGHRGVAEGLPIEPTLAILREAGVLD